MAALHDSQGHAGDAPLFHGGVSTIASIAPDVPALTAVSCQKYAMGVV